VVKKVEQSPLPPLHRDEEFTKEVILKALHDKPIITLPLDQVIEGKEYRWVQNILPDGRIEWKYEKAPVTPSEVPPTLISSTTPSSITNIPSSKVLTIEERF